MSNGPVDPQAAAASVFSSAAGLEMTIRIGQSLELIDALWDLVGVVVAAGTEHDARSPMEIADASPAGRRLNDDTRARLCAAARALDETTRSVNPALSSTGAGVPRHTVSRSNWVTLSATACWISGR